MQGAFSLTPPIETPISAIPPLPILILLEKERFRILPP